MSWRCPSCGYYSDRIGAERFPLKCRCGLRYETLESAGAGMSRASSIPFGPGTELTALFAELGITEKLGCNCRAIAAEMDQAGVAGCRAKREYFLDKLQQNAQLYSWWEKLKAGSAAWCQGKPLTLGGLFDEAMRRVEAIEQPLPYGGPTVRHLVYVVGPFAGNGGVWQSNVAQLRRRIGLFNGRRVAAILTGDQLDPPAAVRREFAGDVEEFLEIPNNPSLREVVAFHPLFERIASTAASEITFFAHTKGVTKPVNDGVTVHRWATLMYETCLDYLPLVEQLLERHPVAGSFKRIGNLFRGSASTFHYSGTYYWLRNCKVFHRPRWREIDQRWWGTESWPGIQYRPEHGGTIFLETDDQACDLYQLDVMRERIEPAFADWRRAHEHFRTAR